MVYAFCFLGGIILGQNVVKTLAGGIIPSNFMNLDVALVILLSSTVGLFIANLLRVPESTSWTTVFAISGVGLALNHLNFWVYAKIIPFWIILPAVAFALTYFLYKIIYPPRRENLYLYQAFLSNEKKVKALVFLAVFILPLRRGLIM
ncbi:MAG: inorganic phosphate transporter [Candidatus Margulisiibacteriota bacterium]